MTTSCGSDRSTRCSTSAGSGTGTIVSPLPLTQRARKSGTVRPAAEKKSIVGDRKSTRLNSSHGYISYAVFCLKKKKKALLRLVVANAKPEGVRLLTQD